MPEEPYAGHVKGGNESADWALCWAPDAETPVAESYVNLIPTPQGGTHVNGLRSGATDAVREFCEFRNLVPRGLKLAPEDVWSGVAFVLSVRMQNPQFAGQTKERLSSRESAAFVSGVVKDAFALWLNQHPEAGEKIAQFAIGNAQERTKAAARVTRKRITSGPGAARQARRLHAAGARSAASCSWSRATPRAAPPSRRATARSRPSCRCAARS